MFSVFFILIVPLLPMSYSSTDQFCVRDRTILMAGVFNFKKIVFAYSWKNINYLQTHIVWTFKVKNNKLMTVHDGTSIDQIFPGVPLFRAGFGLTLKCSDSDSTCNLYNNLVFIFFLNHYKVFRFIENRFREELNQTKIPWGLKSHGVAKDFAFNIAEMGQINGIAFVADTESRLFAVADDRLYTSVADITSSGLQWTLQNEEKFSNIMGVFVVAEDLILNTKESADGLLLIYDPNEDKKQKMSVWEYFGCDSNDNSQREEEPGSDRKTIDYEEHPENPSVEELNDKYAAIIITVVIIGIIISNTIAAIFWMVVGIKKRGSKKITQK